MSTIIFIAIFFGALYWFLKRRRKNKKNRKATAQMLNGEISVDKINFDAPVRASKKSDPLLSSRAAQTIAPVITTPVLFTPTKKEPISINAVIYDQDEKLKEMRDTAAAALKPQSWDISISFSRSHSANFERALFLAKKAPEYKEITDGKNEIYQARYSAKPEEYLAFIKLYEMISGWKSAHVSICGELIDRKIVGQLNYCYGDRCRSLNSKYCYGASPMTENPFGCHRFQVNACNNPWIDFYIPILEKEFKGKLWLDKMAIKERIDTYAAVYRLCPVFDYARALDALIKLPTIITEREYKKMLTVEL